MIGGALSKKNKGQGKNDQKKIFFGGETASKCKKIAIVWTQIHPIEEQLISEKFTSLYSYFIFQFSNIYLLENT